MLFAPAAAVFPAPGVLLLKAKSKSKAEKRIKKRCVKHTRAKCDKCYEHTLYASAERAYMWHIEAVSIALSLSFSLSPGFPLLLQDIYYLLGYLSALEGINCH